MNQQDNNRLDIMAEELETLKKDVLETKAMVKDVYVLLAGNPIDRDSTGLIGDFKQVKKEVYTMKAEIKKYKSYFYAIVTLVGVGALKVIIDLLKS
jgi:predicted phage-related endonuclease